MNSRWIIRQTSSWRTISGVASVERESATRISSATPRTDSTQARMLPASFLQGISTVSFWASVIALGSTFAPQ